jgi:hypothetical protein
MILHIYYVYTSEFERYYFNQCIRVRLIENLYINTRHSHLGDSCKKQNEIRKNEGSGKTGRTLWDKQGN